MEKMTNPIELDGKVAVVTGSNGGIGRAVVELLRAQGATVIATDLHQPDGDTEHFMQLDVADTKRIDEVAVGVKERFGALDIWINNAGMLVRAPAGELTQEAWDLSLNVNLRSTVFASRAAAAAMGERGGAIVNLSSYAGLKARPNCIDYAAAKAGVHHATKCMALEFGPRGIRVNCIAPGYIETPMSSWMHADPVLKNEYLAKTPLRRLGQPQDVALGVLYLVSPMAAYVTGHTLLIDGGCMHG